MDVAEAGGGVTAPAVDEAGLRMASGQVGYDGRDPLAGHHDVASWPTVASEASESSRAATRRPVVPVRMAIFPPPGCSSAVGGHALAGVTRGPADRGRGDGP